MAEASSYKDRIGNARKVAIYKVISFYFADWVLRHREVLVSPNEEPAGMQTTRISLFLIVV